MTVRKWFGGQHEFRKIPKCLVILDYWDGIHQNLAAWYWNPSMHAYIHTYIRITIRIMFGYIQSVMSDDGILYSMKPLNPEQVNRKYRLTKFPT